MPIMLILSRLSRINICENSLKGLNSWDLIPIRGICSIKVPLRNIQIFVIQYILIIYNIRFLKFSEELRGLDFDGVFSNINTSCVKINLRGSRLSRVTPKTRRDLDYYF